MAAAYQGQDHNQVKDQGHQPVIVHVHVHMHHEEKQDKPLTLHDQTRYYYQPQIPQPVLHESPLRVLKHTRSFGLPHPRSLHSRNQLPRLVCNNNASDPVPAFISQTPKLVQNYFSPGRPSVQDFQGSHSSLYDVEDNTRPRCMHRDSRPIKNIVPLPRHQHKTTVNSNLVKGQDFTTKDHLHIEKIVQSETIAKRDDNHYISDDRSGSTKPDLGPIFKPGYSEKYIRNVQRQTVIKPGARLPNMLSIDPAVSSIKEQSQVGRIVYKPLKQVCTDREHDPASFELREPRFLKSGMSGSSSMTSLDENTQDKREAFNRAKYRPVFKDDVTGKTFRIHSMVPIQEEQRRYQYDTRRFYDDNCNLVYKDNPAAPRNKRYSMPAEMSSFRLDRPNTSPDCDKLKRETEEIDELQSILQMTETMLNDHSQCLLSLSLSFSLFHLYLLHYFSCSIQSIYLIRYNC